MDITNVIRVVTDDESRIPRFAHVGDAGADIYSAEDYFLAPGERHLFSTGIRVAVPENHFLMLCSRSGLAANYGVECLIAPGIIDSGYRGELKVCLYNTSDEVYFVDVGERIAQAILVPMIPTRYVRVGDLDKTDRGEGGFGSTGY